MGTRLEAGVLCLLLESLQLCAAGLLGGSEAAVQLGEARRQQRRRDVHRLARRLHAQPAQERARPAGQRLVLDSSVRMG